MTTTNTVPAPSLADAAFKARLQQLRQTDNLTNWYYLARTYLYLAVVLGGAVWFFEARESWGLAWWWNVPVALAAIVLVGAGQHQLSGLAHEGSHYILFRNRILNDLVSDLFCMFPLFASIYHYRLQHLAHHQFVNDPDRDPDVSQLRTSGHWLGFPLPKRDFLLALVKQLWPLRLIRFMRVRAKYNATGTDSTPYLIKGLKPSKAAVLVGVGYLLTVVASLTALFYLVEDWWPLVVVPLTLWLVVCLVFWKLPDDKFHKSRLNPVIHARYTSMLRVGTITAAFVALTVATKLTGSPYVGYGLLLWVVPLFTSFAFFMILRQLVQHGNGGRGWVNNTRTFVVAAPIRFAVFPMGQDYHLPHHMFCTVPHYNLKQLHDLLMQYPEYQAEAVVVVGYFFSPEKPQVHPTVVDVVGPEYAPKSADVHIDNEVLGDDNFRDREAIEREGELSRAANRAQQTDGIAATHRSESIATPVN
jgi:fatty acid desaturase